MLTAGTTNTGIQGSDGNDDIFETLLAPLAISPQLELSHRVVLAPVTRCRALNYVPQDAHVQFYALRATKGGLLITEAVAVSQQGIGFPHSPGIWSEEQVDAWRRVVAAVHAKGGLIFCQLWHVGRASHAYYQPEGCKPVSSTARQLPPDSCRIRLPDGASDAYAEPRALGTAEIAGIVEQFGRAARNARRAGFDGVEIHAGHGYLLDQFLKDGINDREDAYGGSVENRCRLVLEVLGAVAGGIGGEDRTALRISPVIDHLGATDSDPIALGLHLISQLNARRRRRLAYLHLTEPRFNNKGPTGLLLDAESDDSCDVFRAAYDGVVMRSGGYARGSGMDAVRRGAADLVSFGRLFVSNPDLALRFALGAPLNAYDRATFYTHEQYDGYLDYPCLSEKEAAKGWEALRRRRRQQQRQRQPKTTADRVPRPRRLAVAACGPSSPAAAPRFDLASPLLTPSPSPKWLF